MPRTMHKAVVLAPCLFACWRCSQSSLLALPQRGLLAEVPRQLLQLPQDKYLGPGYDLATARVHRTGRSELNLTFMLDSALTTSMLWPSVAESLDMNTNEASDQQKVMAAASEQRARTIPLQVGELVGTGLCLGTLRPLVVEFPQRSIGQSLGRPVDGMLGMEFYERFVVEVDANHLRLHGADSGEALAEERGLLRLTTAPLPARLLGVHLGIPGQKSAEDVLGILDTGASHTVINWAAARILLGVTEADLERLVEDGGSTNSFDLSGKPIEMPIIEATFELRGAGRAPQGAFRAEPVEVAIGNIALFTQLLGRDVESPAALIGQDLLIQRPMLLAARQRLLCFEGG